LKNLKKTLYIIKVLITNTRVKYMNSKWSNQKLKIRGVEIFVSNKSVDQSNLNTVYTKELLYIQFLKKIIPAPGLEPGPLTDKVLSLACLPIPSYRPK
jgi:hypothetical protein